VVVIPDDEGREVPVPATVGRVVSIVPSLTEAVAETAPGLLVGATDWCTHPADLDVARIGGTKNPRVAQIAALAPDLVLANQEENRVSDLDELRACGLPVYVTDIRTLDGAFGSLTRMLAACGLARPAWLDEAVDAWARVPDRPRRRRAVVPIWRRPWMAVGRDTFTGSVLHRAGVENVLAASPDRYPRFDPDALPEHDLVVLPDEPYLFTADDGPEAFPGVPAALVSGRLLTWYGPSLTEAARALPAALHP
jgi:ABC-type Fe3+-hydroxamate transport system substrate-binding protein